MPSTQTFTKEVVNSLDITTLFNDLMKTSVDKDSIYIRSKESLEAMFEEGSYTNAEKAEFTIKLLTSMTASITNQAMQVAYQASKDNLTLPYDLAKLVADTKLTQEQADKLSEDKDLTEAQKQKMIIDGWKTQADIFSKNGINVTANSIENPILGTVDQSNVFATDLTNGEATKVSKFVQLNNTFRRDGIFLPTYNAGGDVTAAAEQTTTWTPLAKAQTDVSIRQEQAFDDNMQQHAANSTANMIGLLLSTENFDAITQTDVNKWRTAIDYLNSPVAP